ncbi:MAG TPA: tetratricopeptide repeat protein, partial [Armatimonadota bacterium]|nr:tetratricopeptide repeat protein [Armatimonadota bacterium]
KRFPEARAAYAPILASESTPALRLAAQLGIAASAMEMKEYRPALDAAHEAGRLASAGSSEQQEAMLLSAGAHYGLKEYPAALADYQQVAAGKQPEKVEEALYWSGSALRAMGKPDEAIAAFNKLLQRFPTGSFAARAKLRIGDCQAEAGHTDLAAAAYRQVLEQYAGSDAAKEAQAALTDLVGRAGSGAGGAAQLARVVGQLPPGTIAANAQLQLAQQEFNAGRYAQAAEWAGKVLASKADPQAMEQAAYLLGASRLQMGNATAAAEAYNQLLTIAPQGKLVNAALLELSWAQLDQKQPAAAEKTLQRLLARNPTADLRLSALLTLAEAATGAGDYPAADAACEKALAANPKPNEAASALYALALSAHRQEKYIDAVPRWQKALDALKKLPDSPLTPQAEYFLGYALTQLKRYVEANPHLEAVAASRNELAEQARYDLAWNCIELKQSERAATEFERLATDFPKGRYAAEALFLAGEQYFARKEYVPAAERYRRADALKPQGELAGKIVMQLGAALYYLQDYPGAAAAFARAAALGGKDASEATYWAGASWAKAEKWDQARPLFERYLALSPTGEHAAAACLGSARAALAAGDALQAIASCERGLQSARGDLAAELQFRLGDALLRQKKAGDAASAYLKVAILYPESSWASDAQYQAGQAFEAAGDRERAISVYRALITKSPQSNAATKAKARLTALAK